MRLPPIAAALLACAAAAPTALAAPVTAIPLPTQPGRPQLAAIPGTPGGFVAWLDQDEVADACSTCVRSPFTTLDGGRTWRPATSWPTTGDAIDVTADPRRAGRLWALADDQDASPSVGPDLLRSDDTGVTWTRIGAARSGVAEIAASADLLVLAGEDILTSVDGTRFSVARETDQSEGLAVSADGRRVYVEALDYLLREPDGDPFEITISVSADAGRTWGSGATPALLPVLEFDPALAVDPGEPRTLLVGGSTVVERSTDGGGTLAPFGPARASDYTPHRLGLGILADRTVVAADGAGLLVGPLDGALQRSRIAGDEPGDVAAAGDVALVALANGVLARDGGRLERRAGPPLEAPRVVRDVAALRDGAVLATDHGLLVRRGSAAPTPAAGVPAGLPMRAVAAAGDRAYALARSGAAFRSADGGATWTATAPLGFAAGRPTLLAIGRDATVLAASGRSVRVSDDAGATWRRVVALPRGTTADSLAASPVDARIAWVGTERGALRRTTDGGRTWRVVLPRPRFRTSLRLLPDPGRARTVTVVTDRRVLQLVGRTVTARPLLPAGTWVSFARDGASLVGLRAAGQTFVARSIDGGRSWRRERAIPGVAGELAIGAGHVAWAAGDNGTGDRFLLTWTRP